MRRLLIDLGAEPFLIVAALVGLGGLIVFVASLFD